MELVGCCDSIKKGVFRKMRIEHIAMYVNDLEKTKDFLSDILMLFPMKEIKLKLWCNNSSFLLRRKIDGIQIGKAGRCKGYIRNCTGND